MRIALVSPYDYATPGGVTAHIVRLREEFTRLGHHVRIIAPSSRPEDPPDSGVIVCGRPWAIPANGSVARIAISLRLSSQVKAILQREAFDVVHLHEPLVPTLAITVLRFSQSVNVGTFHAHSDRSLAYFYGKRILKRWFRKLDGKIAVSRPAMEFVSQYFPGYYNIIPNGVNVERFGPQVEPFPPEPGYDFTILFVGRLEHRKGLKYLIRAFAGVKRQFPRARLVVVGDGALRAEYERAIALSGLRDVVFTGYVPDADLPRYYRSADVFCAPATGGESQGVVLLEAMASGMPIVASAIEGYASVLTHGQEGFLVPPRDVEALSLAIVHLLADRSLRARMGAAGHQTAQEYSWERIAQRVLAYYERILGEAASGPRHGYHPTRLLPRLIPRWLQISPG
ncbi:MAG: glycosyltransferase family 4 protein [Chloroflexi bacterium]|nr:glycosyltransferase family 4 protein [Chloroflexota bacterium]